MHFFTNIYFIKIFIKCRYPVPIHTIPKTLDYILFAERPCNRWNGVSQSYLESHEYKTEIGKLKNLIQYLEKNSGMQIGEKLRRLHFLYDTLWIEDLKNKTWAIRLTFNIIVWIWHWTNDFYIWADCQTGHEQCLGQALNLNGRPIVIFKFIRWHRNCLVYLTDFFFAKYLIAVLK